MEKSDALIKSEEWLAKAKSAKGAMMPAIPAKDVHPHSQKSIRQKRSIPSLSEHDHFHAMHAAIHQAKGESHFWSGSHAGEKPVSEKHHALAEKHRSMIHAPKDVAKRLEHHYDGSNDMEGHINDRTGHIKVPHSFKDFNPNDKQFKRLKHKSE